MRAPALGRAGVRWRPGVLCTTDVPIVHWTRLNRHYRPAVEFARLLLHHNSIDLQRGPQTTLAITLQMDRVIEQFVRGASREALGGD